MLAARDNDRLTPSAADAAQRIAELGRVYAQGFITRDELTALVLDVLLTTAQPVTPHLARLSGSPQLGVAVVVSVADEPEHEHDGDCDRDDPVGQLVGGPDGE
jgi:hypothetical protein